MKYQDNHVIEANDLSFDGVLRDVKKSQAALQPIFECFTNALEAVRIKQKFIPGYKGKITIKIDTTETLIENDELKRNTEFSSLSITDDGIGFNDEEFSRFNKYKQSDKGFNNLGSGRIQFVHYFDSTTVKSVFEQDGKFFERKFHVSKNKDFLGKNAIVKHIYCKETDALDTETTVSFKTLLNDSNGIYDDLNAQTLKDKLIERYIYYFCYNKDNLPEISIEFHIRSKLQEKSCILQTDIPKIDKTCQVTIPYSTKGRKGTKKTKIQRFSLLMLLEFQKNF